MLLLIIFCLLLWYLHLVSRTMQREGIGHPQNLIELVLHVPPIICTERFLLSVAIIRDRREMLLIIVYIVQRPLQDVIS
jgi:hypothetical protein